MNPIRNPQTPHPQDRPKIVTPVTPPARFDQKASTWDPGSHDWSHDRSHDHPVMMSYHNKDQDNYSMKTREKEDTRLDRRVAKSSRKRVRTELEIEDNSQGDIKSPGRGEEIHGRREKVRRLESDKKEDFSSPGLMSGKPESCANQTNCRILERAPNQPETFGRGERPHVPFSNLLKKL